MPILSYLESVNSSQLSCVIFFCIFYAENGMLCMVVLLYITLHSNTNFHLFISSPQKLQTIEKLFGACFFCLINFFILCFLIFCLLRSHAVKTLLRCFPFCSWNQNLRACMVLPKKLKATFERIPCPSRPSPGTLSW